MVDSVSGLRYGNMEVTVKKAMLMLVALEMFGRCLDQ